MTEYELDRVTGAWLDLMPTEVPDRVIANVLQAVDATPQVRRPIVPARWRPYQMNRKLSFVAATAAVLVVGLIGFSLAGGKPAPTVGASTLPSVAASHVPLASAPIPAGATAVADNAALLSGKRYVVAGFTPAFTFTGQTGASVWTADPSLLQVDVDPTGKHEGAEFTVVRVGQVIEPGGESGGAGAALPADFVGWFRARPDLILEPPAAIKVSGIDATMLRGTVRPEAVAAYQPARLEIACEAGVPSCSGGSFRSAVTLWAGSGGGFEVVALKVQGQQILISLSSASWDTYRPELEAFLAGITFE